MESLCIKGDALYKSQHVCVLASYKTQWRRSICPGPSTLSATRMAHFYTLEAKSQGRVALDSIVAVLAQYIQARDNA